MMYYNLVDDYAIALVDLPRALSKRRRIPRAVSECHHVLRPCKTPSCVVTCWYTKYEIELVMLIKPTPSCAVNAKQTYAAISHRQAKRESGTLREALGRWGGAMEKVLRWALRLLLALWALFILAAAAAADAVLSVCLFLLLLSAPRHLSVSRLVYSLYPCVHASFPDSVSVPLCAPAMRL